MKARKPRLQLSHKTTRAFVIFFLVAAFVVAGLAVRTALRLASDEEIRDQLEDVHDRASRGDTPAPSAND